MNLTGPEKVLWKANYKFAIEILKFSEERATQKALDKIASTRAMALKLKNYQRLAYKFQY